MTSATRDSGEFETIGTIDRFFGPARGLVPGFVVMMLCALLALVAGLHNVFDPPHRADRTLAFMLATGAFPCPYIVYSALCFLLMHLHPSTLLVRLFYVSFIPLLAAPIVVGKRHFAAAGDLPFNVRLDSTLINNLWVSVVIGLTFLLIMAVVVFAARWAQRDDIG